VTIADILISSVKVLVALAWLKQIDLAGQWLVQHPASIRALQDSRPRLEEACYKYPTNCSLPTNPALPALMHTSAHTYQFASSPWACALDCYMVLVLRSRSKLDLLTSGPRNKEKNPH